MKLTNFGKVIRKLRIDKNMLLGNMATKLNISSAYLSAIELGNRDIPSDLLNNIKGLKIFSESEIDLLEEAIMQDKKVYNLVPQNKQQNNMLLDIARNINCLSDEQIRRIQNIINN